ncbi:MAG: hypothetical protein ABI199_00480 [Bacteroidia bacterium]
MQQKKIFLDYKKNIFLTLCCLSVLISPAQIISENPFQMSLSDPSFNATFIQKNKIKSISAALVIKPDGKPIIDQGLSKYYQFDSINGALIYSYFNLNRGRDLFDTIPTYFYYDAQKRLSIKRSNEGDFYDSWYFVYDSVGQKVKETHFREVNGSIDPNVFKLKEQTVLSFDSCTFQQLTKTQLKKYFFNDEKKSYKQSIVNFDALGKKINERESFLYTWVRTETSCKYDSIGRVSEYDYTSNASGNLNEKTHLHYNKQGNLDDVIKYRNANEIHEIAYLYTDSTGILNSMIDRDFIEKNILIVKFSYDYFVPPATNSFK